MNGKKILNKRTRLLPIIALLLILSVAVAGCDLFAPEPQNPTSGGSDSGSETTEPEKEEEKEEDKYAKPDVVTRGDYTLDANYSRLLLVNAEYPLPDDYNYGWNLTKIEDKYHNGELNQIDAGIWPYMKAMIEAAWSDGVKLYVWSPYRSYNTQKMLFENRVKKEGGDEAKAAQSVARPGTSEHNTGLCADFNMASSKFESTEMFTWMCGHAEDYGFILRYPQDRIDITGVKYESWHWRFVGINRAKEINNLNVTLEEYIELKGLDPQADLYKE